MIVFLHLMTWSNEQNTVWGKRYEFEYDIQLLSILYMYLTFDPSVGNLNIQKQI